MRKLTSKLVLIVFFQLLAGVLFGQKQEIRVNAGANFTIMPDISYNILIANDGLEIPGFINLANSISPIIVYETTSPTSTQPGFFAEIEYRVKHYKSFCLSFGIGIIQLRYKFDSYIDMENSPKVWLRDISPEYGKMNYVFLNIKPMNVSLDLLNNRLHILVGPKFDILLKEEYNNIVLKYADEASGNEGKVERAYFVDFGYPNDFTYGLHLKTAFDLTDILSIFVSGQYSLNETLTRCPDYKPFLIQTGLGVNLWKF